MLPTGWLRVLESEVFTVASVMFPLQLSRKVPLVELTVTVAGVLCWSCVTDHVRVVGVDWPIVALTVFGETVMSEIAALTAAGNVARVDKTAVPRILFLV
jgi:hypothetical protein